MTGTSRTLAAAAVLLVALVGCGKTVEGKPVPVGSGPSAHADFPKLMRECKIVDEDKIAKYVGAQGIDDTFTGAICRWNGVGPSGTVHVVLNWFETGSLRNERDTATKLKYQIGDITIQGGRGVRLQRPGDTDACGVSVTAFDAGVLGWWVHYMPGSSHPDPCEAAKKLAEASLNLTR
ncbi:MAG: DUF3558 domain-containing protein [Mycobacteriaceae bacterium]|nr:DUF3558 domain-containing protein [Mycobacteriaceae bacterium]